MKPTESPSKKPRRVETTRLCDLPADDGERLLREGSDSDIDFHYDQAAKAERLCELQARTCMAYVV